MRTIKLTKTPAGFELLSDWHARFEKRLPYPVRTVRVETSFGYSDVLATGPQTDEPPVVLLHGAMAGAPHALGELANLPGQRPFYAVNIPGQSTRVEQVRLDFKSDEYSRWLCEVLDQLGLERARLCGVSWGGSVALQLAKHCPARIESLLLIVPGSIVSGPVWQGMKEVGLPMLRYKLFPNEQNRERAFRGILTNTDEFWLPYLADAMAHWNIDFSAPPLVSKSDMSGLQAPVFVVAADQDLSFPGEPLLVRSREIFPNLVGTRLLSNSRHTPSFRPEDRAAMAKLFDAALQKLSTAPVTA